LENFDDTVAAAERGPAGGLLASESFWAWEQDRQLRYTHVIPVAISPAFDPRSIVGRRRWELPEAQPVDGIWAEHRHGLAERLPFHNFRYLVFADSGHPRCLLESGEPRFDAHGAFVGYRGTTRDVTQQWLQQRKLQETEAKLQVAAAVARFGAWSIDVATDRLSWTREASDHIHGGNGALPTGAEDRLQLYAPEHRGLLRDAYRACVRDGTPFDVEAQALTAHGRRKWVRIIGVPVRGADGQVVRVHGAFQDIHKAKVAAEERRRSEEHLRSTLDSLSDGFFTLCPDWRITYVNPAAQEILGMDAQQLLGQVFWDAFPGAEQSAFGRNYHEAMEARRVVRFEAHYPPLDMWFRVSAFPARQGLAISFTDITASRQAQEQLREANARLEQRVEERTEQLRRTNDELASFTVSVAHALRTPLASVDGFSRALAEALPAGDHRLRHFAGRVRAGVARMESLLDALLELSRVGRAPLEPRQVDLGAVARCTVEALRASEPHRVVELQVEDGVMGWGDARLLRTLLENLLGNAWKFSAGRSPARIAFGQGADGAFFVRDNGPGFEEARAAELFAPLRRLHAGDEFGGAGIGLASARRVVERHGGHLWAQTVPGEGAVFYFTLPGPG
jgi:PAS domain S-box-containing protein